MPTYFYRCPSCGHELEKFHKMSAKTRPRCPRCGTAAQRVITGGAGLLFKGSGFYITDYKKAQKGQAQKGQAQKGQEQKGQERQEGQKSEKAEKGDKSEKTDTAPKKPRDEH